MLRAVEALPAPATAPRGPVAAMVDPERIENRFRGSLLKKVQGLVERYPEQALDVLRRWMSER
jgi:flagellar biosynthesis/type III secretory pathway M-ring protein FliF/YscJ